MEPVTQLFSEATVLTNAVTSGVLIVIVVFLRSFVLRAIRNADWANEQMQLRWTVQVRWAAFLLILLGLVVIWATELRTLALSVVAIAAAIVIATKELILCFLGSIVRATSKAYSVGDRVELDTTRGDVVHIGALTSTLLEVGPGNRRTGRSVTIPNALLLTKPLINETFTDDFVLHVITIPTTTDIDWRDAEERLLASAKHEVSSFLSDARQHIETSSRELGVPSFSVEPSVSIQVPEAGKLSLAVRVPVRADQRSNLEQKILRRFLDSAPPTPD